MLVLLNFFHWRANARETTWITSFILLTKAHNKRFLTLHERRAFSFAFYSIPQTEIPSNLGTNSISCDNPIVCNKNTQHIFFFVGGFLLCSFVIDAVWFFFVTRLLLLFSRAPHSSKQTETDEQHSLRSPDNERDRRSTHHSDDSGEHITILDRDPTANQTHLNRSPADTNLPSRMSTNVSQFPTDERERRIQDENNALKKVIHRIIPDQSLLSFSLLGKQSFKSTIY